jgi:hypothetical protein
MNHEEDMIKEMLESEKLKIEIKDLKNPVARFIRIYLGFWPVVLGIATVAVAYGTGFFNAKAVQLENQKHDLQDSIIEFTRRKVELLNQEAIIKTRLDSLKHEVDTRDSLNSQLISQNKILNDKNKTSNEKTYALSKMGNDCLLGSLQKDFKIDSLKRGIEITIEQYKMYHEADEMEVTRLRSDAFHAERSMENAREELKKCQEKNNMQINK